MEELQEFIKYVDGENKEKRYHSKCKPSTFEWYANYYLTDMNSSIIVIFKNTESKRLWAYNMYFRNNCACNHCCWEVVETTRRAFYKRYPPEP